MNNWTRVPGETPDTATGTVALPGSKDSASGLQNGVLRYSRLGGLRYNTERLRRWSKRFSALRPSNASGLAVKNRRAAVLRKCGLRAG